MANIYLTIINRLLSLKDATSFKITSFYGFVIVTLCNPLINICVSIFFLILLRVIFMQTYYCESMYEISKKVILSASHEKSIEQIVKQFPSCFTRDGLLILGHQEDYFLSLLLALKEAFLAEADVLRKAKLKTLLAHLNSDWYFYNTYSIKDLSTPTDDMLKLKAMLIQTTLGEANPRIAYSDLNQLAHQTITPKFVTKNFYEAFFKLDLTKPLSVEEISKALPSAFDTQGFIFYLTLTNEGYGSFVRGLMRALSMETAPIPKANLKKIIQFVILNQGAVKTLDPFNASSMISAKKLVMAGLVDTPYTFYNIDYIKP